MKGSLLTFLLLGALLSRPTAGRGEEAVPDPSQALPRRCGACHLEKIRPGTERGFNFLDLRQQSEPGEGGMCYSCHNGPVRDSRRSIWTGLQHQAQGRGAATASGGRASCGTCHAPHVQSKGIGTFMRFKKGDSSHCLQCHPRRQGNRTGEHPSVSGGEKSRPVDVPSCGACHRVHRAAAAGLIRESSQTQLCSRCHGDNPSREGTGPGTASHAVGGEGPSCSTCHTVHRAPAGDLLKRGASDSSLCLRCHETLGGRKKGDGNHSFRPGRVGCLSCHRAHNAATLGTSAALLAREESSMDRVCRDCHAAQLSGEGGWNHPLDRDVTDTTGARLAKLFRYGGRLAPGGKVQCLTCHRSHNAHRATANLVVGRQALCLYCHGDQNFLSPKTGRIGTHPVSVRPRKAIIAEPFLQGGGTTGENGEIICTTCHRAHEGEQDTDGLVISRQEYTCSLCHTDKSGLAGTGHGRTEKSGDDGEAVDPCRNCHGSHGWNVDFEAVKMGGNILEKVCWSCHGPDETAPMPGYFGHSIGVPSTGGSWGRDLPLFWSDGRRLEQGLISCATCHDVHRGRAEYFLRTGPEETRSAICLGCHRRQGSVTGTKHDMSLFFPGAKNRRGENASRTGPCGACHLVHSGGPSEAWARDVEIASGQPVELVSFCFSCHREGSFAQGKTIAETGHPSPEVLQTRPDTVITDCSGCHNPHLWNPTDTTDKGDFFTPGDHSNSFLVSPSGPESTLCRKCHTEKFALAGSQHDFSGKTEGGKLCEACHISHGGQAVLMWPSEPSGESAYGSSTCLSCHPKKEGAAGSEQDGFNHPIGISPGPSPTEDLPLFTSEGRRHDGGKMSCGTCHDPHRWSPSGEESPSASAGTGPANSFLRLPSDGFSPLCFPCHANQAMMVGTDHDLRVTAPESLNPEGLTAEESGVCGSCHRMHGVPSPFALWSRDLGKGEDLQSRHCRNCHDEGAMEEATVPSRIETHLVDYPGKGMVSRIFAPLRASILDMATTFTLYNNEGEQENDRGFLSCASCHDVHIWEPDTSRSGVGVPLNGDMKNSFLKARTTFAIGRSFCKQCHGEDTLELYRNYHFPGGKDPGGDDQGP